jgi:hypothetical protein
MFEKTALLRRWTLVVLRRPQLNATSISGEMMGLDYIMAGRCWNGSRPNYCYSTHVLHVDSINISIYPGLFVCKGCHKLTLAVEIVHMGLGNRRILAQIQLLLALPPMIGRLCYWMANAT